MVCRLVIFLIFYQSATIMKCYGNIEIAEGSTIKNLVAPTEEQFPTPPTEGEFALINGKLYIYINSTWTTFQLDGFMSGWKDLTSDIKSSGVGSNDPTWSLMFDGIYAHKFNNNNMNQCWTTFHIDHDYKLGSPIHLHIHWTTSDAGSGTVRWGFEYTIAKSHQQEAFPKSSIVYVEQSCVPTARTHYVAEITTGLTSNSFEPDTLILVRVFRDAANLKDTCTSQVFGLTVDCHYQIDRFATVNKAPNFYA